SAIVRNGTASNPIANEMISNNAIVHVLADGLLDLNTQTETIAELQLSAGQIRTGNGGSLRFNPASQIQALRSTASATTALIDARGGDIHLNGDRSFHVADGSAETDLEIRGSITDGTKKSG